MSEKMNFQAEVNKMLNIVVNSLYSEKYIFLRELISNASDACDKLKYLMLTKPDIAKGNGELKIVVKPDDKNNTLTISDNGIGMNKEDLINHLGTIAKSGTSDFVAAMKENGSAADLIGQFGVGFYSAFMVADKVEILTKKAGEEKAYKWVSNGVDGFEIEEAEKENVGTEIKLLLKEDAKNFTDTIYLRHLIRTYSDHINYPIVLNLGEAGEETVNTGSALWTRNKSEINEEQYKEFYHHISHNFDDPWLTLHYKAEGSIEYTALLFIPSSQPYDLFQPDHKESLKLYVNRVFVSDKVEELMKAFEEANINKMKLELHDLKLELEKSSGAVQKSIETRREEAIEVKEPQSDILAYKVKSPLVGTFYASSSPDAKAYVQVGDHVTKGTTLCIIEAMKVMNEIKAPVDGVIQKILVQTNDMVEYDQVIMTIEED